MTQPLITYNKDGSLSSLSGREAVDLMRIQSCIMGIRLHIESEGRIQITRGMGIMKLLKIAESYTKKSYKRTQGDAAITDLSHYFQLLKSTIPTETK
jgi:hypothetical protein